MSTEEEAPKRGTALILGIPYFGQKLAAELTELGWEARYLPHPGRSARGWARVLGAVLRADILYLVSSRIEKGSPQDRMLRLRRKPVVIHWVGTDVKLAREVHRKGRVSVRIAEKAHHWCDAPWLVQELRTIGVSSEFVPLPIKLHEGRSPTLPAEFGVLLYCPQEPAYREVFDLETMLRLPEAFPDVRFTLVASPPESLPGPLPPNLEALAWVDDMEPIYRNTTVYVRLTHHDGQSFMAAEALSRGRYVIWTHPMPGCIQAKGFEEVLAALKSLLEKHRAGALSTNLEGRRAATNRFGKNRPLLEIDERLRILLGR